MLAVNAGSGGENVSYVLGCYGKQGGVPGYAKRDILGHGGAADPPRARMSALVQIASDGNDRGDGFRGEGIKGRWTKIWR
jgi:hypothetical protein